MRLIHISIAANHGIGSPLGISKNRFLHVFELRFDLVIDLFGFGRGNCYGGESIRVSMVTMDAMEVGMGIGTGVWVSSITSMSISGNGAVIVVPIGCSNSYGGNSRGGNHLIIKRD